MLSGIGPKNVLERFGINQIVELPGVGANLQDRYEVGVVSKLQSDFDLIRRCGWGKTPDPCLEEWRHQEGPYASNGFIAGIVKRSDVAELDPDLFLFGGPAFFKGYYPGYSKLTIADKKHFTWVILKAHTRNRRGVVTLKSADPRETPYVNFNYFDEGTTGDQGDNLDLNAVAEGVALAREVMNNVGIFAGHIEEEVPRRDVTSFKQIQDFIKNEAWGHHASCTCRIGSDDDKSAVLDSRFRVRGVQNLRVVDASVFPHIPGVFIILPVFMISEKATDVILQDIN
jgi:choline dehydrogenase